MDLKVLFHNPEELSDQELHHLRMKIQFQHSMPWLSAFFGGFSLYLLDVGVLRRNHNLKSVAVGALGGFLLGAYSSYQVRTSLPRPLDNDIINAFDKKYMNTVLNTTGFGSNYVSSKDYSNVTTLRKPY